MSADYFVNNSTNPPAVFRAKRKRPRSNVGSGDMTLTYRQVDGVVRCIYCGQDGLVCNLWNESTRCVERATLDVVKTAATTVQVNDPNLT